MPRAEQSDDPIDQIVGRLTVVAGVDVGLIFDVGVGFQRIGRDPSAEIQLAGRGISRAHASVVQHEDSRLRLVDLGSSNGVFVNDVRVETAILREGDRLRIGKDAVLVVSYVRPDEQDTFDLAVGPGAARPIADKMAGAMRNLARVRLSRQEYGAALRALQRARVKVQEQSDVEDHQLAGLLSDIAECHLGLGDPVAARSMAEHALTLFGTRAAPFDIAPTRFALARAMRDVDVIRARELALLAKQGLDPANPLARRIEAWLEDA